MPRETSLDDVELIRRYTEQPARLPPAARQQIQQGINDATLLAYALLDLDERLRLCERWLVLTPSAVVVWEPGAPPEIQPRSRVERCTFERGLSMSTLRIELRGTSPLVGRYTHRQRTAVDRVTHALDGAPGLLPASADAAYAAEVARPIRHAQALVSKNGLFILARLLRYLLPYRRQLLLGFGAALVITLCALLPPYLTGYLIDGVLRPVQNGQLRAEQVALIGWLCVGAMTAVYVLRRAATWIRLRLMAVLGENVARDLRSELYEHLQRLSVAFLTARRPAA
jgi:ATP-binding cassette subfamily B protein